jgi:hypothetical protein
MARGQPQRRGVGRRLTLRAAGRESRNSESKECRDA